jgi:hypothetical protein
MSDARADGVARPDETQGEELIDDRRFEFMLHGAVERHAVKAAAARIGSWCLQDLIVESIQKMAKIFVSILHCLLSLRRVLTMRRGRWTVEQVLLPKPPQGDV